MSDMCHVFPGIFWVVLVAGVLIAVCRVNYAVNGVHRDIQALKRTLGDGK